MTIPRDVQRDKLKHKDEKQRSSCPGMVKKLQKPPIIDSHGCRKSDQANRIEERNKACSVGLGGGEEIEAKGGGKGGWEPVKRNRQGWSVAGTNIA